MPGPSQPSRPVTAGRLSLRALNRALLARQGLLARRTSSLVEAVEAIGALQAQSYGALPVALWSRVEGVAPEDLHAALDRRDLLLGTSLRGTLHLVSAREWPLYAAVVAEASGGTGWRHTKGSRTDGAGALRAEVVRAAGDPRTQAELAAVCEAWAADHAGAFEPEELAHQRAHGWKRFVRWCGLVRAPADGTWGVRTPSAYLAPPPSEAADPETAVDAIALRHLQAFGPASVDDLATWTGLRAPVARAAHERLGERAEAVEVADEDGRALLDAAGAPRADEDGEAPVRFLPEFDSTLLAYAPKHRTRILPGAHREATYQKGNLRVLPTALVDGFVAATWSVAVERRTATLTVVPLEPLGRAAKAALRTEGEELLRATQPRATAHTVAVV